VGNNILFYFYRAEKLSFGGGNILFSFFKRRIEGYDEKLLMILKE
jgi:hypothetical protein